MAERPPFVASPGATWALVPLKSSHQAKSRLASVLDATRRSRLFFTMAHRVIESLRACRLIHGVAVVTANEQVASFAAKLGAWPILQTADLGMSQALSHALRALQSVKPGRVLMLPGDLPLLTPMAVGTILTADSSGPGVVLVPDRHGVGTNALLCEPPDIIAPSFGGESFERHLHAAKNAGVRAHVLHLANIALDIDVPDDLNCWGRQRAPARPAGDVPAGVIA